MTVPTAPAAEASGVSRRTLFVRIALAAVALGLLLLAGQGRAAPWMEVCWSSDSSPRSS